MPRFAPQSFRSASAQLRIMISKAVTSVQWLVVRAAKQDIAPYSGTRHTSLATRHSSLATVLCATVLLALATLHSPLLYAQTGLATLSGTITDPSGAIITKANVTVTNEATNVAAKTQTTGAGVYVMPDLPPGLYRVLVEHQGFKQIEVEHLELHTQDTISRNFILPVGAASETIQVSGNQNATNDSPAVSMTVNRDFVEDMPLNGRSLTDLIALTPGAAYAAGDTYSINGQRPDSNNYTVDGASAQTAGYNNNGGLPEASALAGSIPSQTAISTTQSLVGLDSLQEFKVQTSGYSAEFGRTPGGQVEFTTRSGTDTLHGSLFEYLRNTVLDANSWSNDVNHLPQAAEQQNDFGGTLGGPLQIPHLYDGKGKTFYFVSYEGLRLLLPISGISSAIPSDAFRAYASPNMQPFLDAMPDPAKSPGYAPIADNCTVPDPVVPTQQDPCDGNFPYSYSTRNNLDAMSFRADHTLTNKWKLFLRYADTPSSTVNPETGNPLVLSNGSHLWTVGATGSLAGNVISETRFNFTHEAENNVRTQVAYQGSIPFSPNLAISSQYLTNPRSETDVNVVVGSLYTNLEYGGYATEQRQYQLVQSLNWTHGVHTVKFGLDWRRILDVNEQQPYASYVIVTSLNDIQEGNATYLVIVADAISYPVFNNLSLYAQDHWKIGERFALDYGLRWELNPPPGVSQGYSPLALNQVSNLATTQASFGPPLYRTQYTKFAPRLGFTYRLNNSSNHAIVLRGGGGIFYDTGQQMAAGAFFSGYPYYAQGPYQMEVPLPLTQGDLAAPTVSLTPPYSNDYYFTDPNLTLPYTEQWNLSLDRTMRSDNVLTVSYVGNAGHKLLADIEARNSAGNLNPAVFGAGQAYINSNAASSSYNALQVMDTGHITRDLQMVGSYTWSHALDDESQNGGVYSLERGNSNYDLRQMLNVAVNYHVPLATGGALRSLGSGWLLATRFVAQGGFPIDLYQTQTDTAQSNFNYTEYRPNLVPGQPIYLHGPAAGAVPRQWRLNRAAFACASGTTTNANGSCSGTPTAQGTLGRNYVRNPTFNNFNVSAERTFPIFERLNLNFRVDAFNVLNHVNVDNPTTYTFANSQFGILTGEETIGSTNALYGTGANRSLQLNLHLQF
jgi:hypothetical protein